MKIIASILRHTGYHNFINTLYVTFIANSSSCTITESSMMILTSCLTAIKNHVIEYCGTVFDRNGRNLFWSVRNPGEILNKF